MSRDRGAPRPSILRRLRSDPARARFWLVLLPIHVIAFGTLYAVTTHLIEGAYAEAGAEAARHRLHQAIGEMPFFLPAVGARNPHVFDHLIVTHAPIGLRLFDADGEALGSHSVSDEPAEVARVRRILASGGKEERVWIEHENGRDLVRGVQPLVADAGCVPCHREGSLVGVATMRIDYTQPLATMREKLRTRVALFAFVWIGLVGVVALAVQRSAIRSAERIGEELQAARQGETPPALDETGGVPLDPVTAEVVYQVRRFLAQERARKSELSSQLARADRLASLGELAAGLAHEIKNPLAGIHSALEVLIDDDPEGAFAPIHSEMLREVQRVNGILQQLLESSRPAHLEVHRTDLVKLLRDLADLLAPALRRREVALEIESAADDLWADVDGARLRQVLVNLVQNAADAMPAGGRITVRASRLPGPGGIVLAVADEGPGIPEAERQRIFEPFYTTKFSGTGLGLAVSRSLVEQHGGRLEVESSVGRGSVFLIFLPGDGPLDCASTGG